jgi:serine/threonine protein kinase
MQLCREPGCGHPNRPSARFCEKCGQPLRDHGDRLADAWSALPRGHLMRGGAYRILEPLGKGGMGALYLAADTGAFDRKCVVKELLDYYDPTDPGEAQQAQDRFETEARLLAELSHPGIQRIYSFFSEAGRHFIVMEYIEGETLELAVAHFDPMGLAVKARPLSSEAAVRHAIRICRVLEYLAGQPIPVVHQDIKPANLIVDKTSGEVRLVDFGTAQTPTRWATQARLDQESSTLFGTPGYAAPEQYQNRSEPRSDVYALAATLYHLLTDDDPGEHPFQFPRMASLPSLLADGLARALRPKVQRRSTALEFRHALAAWLIPDEAAQPFVFRTGAVAHTTEELALLCDQHWAEARSHLVDGDFDRWFRARNRHDLVAKARSAKLEANPDAALEAFLRRLNPRLGLPSLVVEPLNLDFGRIARSGSIQRQLRVRNEGRGYAQAKLNASVPWIRFERDEVGCLSDADSTVKVWLDASALPLRRDHQAVVACTPARGSRISISITAELSLVREALRHITVLLAMLTCLTGRGARRGWGYWMRTFRSLLRSRYGLWILGIEAVILAAMMVALWWMWREPSSALNDLPRVLILIVPLALLIVNLLPVLFIVSGAVVWEIVGALAGRARAALR